MSSSSVNVLDSEYFKKKSRIPLVNFSPNFKVELEVSDKGSDLIAELKFPWTLKDLVSEYPNAKLKSICLSYTPYITMTNHGNVTVYLKDMRKQKMREQNVCEYRFPTDLPSQLIITDLEPCTRKQKNPYVLSVFPSLVATTPDAIIGKISITATFSYSKSMYPIKVPRFDIDKSHVKGKKVNVNINHDDALIFIEITK
ncbi:TPA_asm: P3 [Chrysanthemum betacytorhabdovirus 1]|nr:TPA_asm: P3 [Chrysanthemum betacytorhabdovirus 1]